MRKPAVDFELTLADGTSFTGHTTDEPDSFVESSGRQLVAAQVLGNQSQWASRADERRWYQTSWVKGGQWQAPLVSRANMESFQKSRNFDGSVRPGFLVPTNQLHSMTDLLGPVAISPDSKRIVFTEDDGNRTRWRYRDTSGSTNRTLSNWLNVTLGEPRAACVAGDFSWWLFDDRVCRVELAFGTTVTAGVYPSSTVGLSQVRDAEGDTVDSEPGFGASVFRAVDGRLLIWTGERFLQAVDLTATDVYERVTIFSEDGLGKDFLWDAEDAIVDGRRTNLAIDTGTGIWYVKNVWSNGLPMPRVFRLNREIDGTFTRIARGHLPTGSVALSVGVHMGSLLVLTTSDYEQLFRSGAAGAGTFRTSLWNVSPSGVPYFIGHVSGGTEPEDVACYILGADDRFVYLGGRYAVWRYNAAPPGAIERIYEDETAVGWSAGDAGVNQFFRWSGIGARRCFVGADGKWTSAENEVNETDLKPDARTSPYHYEIVGNPSDFELPHEKKHLTAIEIETEAIPADDDTEVKVWVRADGGSWVAAGTHDEGRFSTLELDETLTGRQFQYRIAYLTPDEATVDVRYDIRSVMFRATCGELVRQYRLKVAPSSLNVGGRAVRPETVYKAWNEAADDASPITFKRRTFDVYASEQRISSRVRIDKVEIPRSRVDKLAPITVVLTEVS